MRKEHDITPLDVLDAAVYLAVILGALWLALATLKRLAGGR